MNICERSQCREKLLKICKRENCTIEELLENQLIYLSDNMKSQAKKMIFESKRFVLNL